MMGTPISAQPCGAWTHSILANVLQHVYLFHLTLDPSS